MKEKKIDIRQTFDFSFVVIVFICSILLFGYRIGFTALQSYDEAWYGVISRNLLSTSNPFLLEFNGGIYTDHPPLGFWLMAIPVAICGSNEVTVRMISVVSGALSLVLMYLIGRQLSNRFVGIAGAAMLFSMMWFVFRVRSGNLDVPFLCFELLTVLAALQKNKYQVYLVAITFASLLLIKTLVGVGLVPVLVFLLWRNRSNISLKSLVFSFLFGSLIVLPWYITNHLHDSHFLYYHFIDIGTRGSNNNFSLNAAMQSFQYLAIGVGKWFKVFILSLPLAMLLLWKKPNVRELIIIQFLWMIGFSPFLISSKTEIWHLLPLYPVLAIVTTLSFFSAVEYLPQKIFTSARWILLFFFVGIAAFQFNQFSNLLYSNSPQYSPEKDIATKAKFYSNLQLLDTFLPSAIYYAEQNVSPLYWHANAYQIIKEQLTVGDDDNYIINQDLKSQLEQDEINFKVLESNEIYFLIGN